MYETFSKAYNEVLDRCRSIRTDTDYLALAKSHVNRMHKETLAYRPWPFLNKAGTIVTEPPYTTGTISVTQGSGAIVGSGTTFTSGHVGWYLKIGSKPDLHLVSTYNSPTSLTVDPVVAIETVSAQSFKLFRATYTLPGDFLLPAELDNFITSPPMSFVGNREYRRLISAPIFSVPEKWTLRWALGSGSLGMVPAMAFFPFPDTYRQIHFDYQVAITDLSGDNDTILIPDPYRAIPVEGAMAMMYHDVFDDEARYQTCKAEELRLRRELANAYGFFDDDIQLVPHNYRGNARTNDDFVVERMMWENR